MSRTAVLRILAFLTLAASTCVRVAAAETVFDDLRDITCLYTEVSGIGLEEGVCRRDPSDVIKVGDTWYVWYTKVTRGDLPETWRSLYPSGYPGRIWFATSHDEGRSWTEQAQALGTGPPGSFDSFGVFTPNVLSTPARSMYLGRPTEARRSRAKRVKQGSLAAQPAIKQGGQYYLYYTAVRPTPGRVDGAFENNSTSDFTAIGLAVADAPDGPFRRVGTEPILRPATGGKRFDSYRVDDASLLIRTAKVWLYYKGRSLAHGRGGPGRTQMGLAVAEQPAGPYVRTNDGQPLLKDSHEVLIWQHGKGVAALASISRTIQYSVDGLHFQRIADLQDRPNAPGAYRSELTEPAEASPGIRWGVSMRHGPHPYLVRFQFNRGTKTARD